MLQETHSVTSLVFSIFIHIRWNNKICLYKNTLLEAGEMAWLVKCLSCSPGKLSQCRSHIKMEGETQLHETGLWLPQEHHGTPTHPHPHSIHTAIVIDKNISKKSTVLKGVREKGERLMKCMHYGSRWDSVGLLGKERSLLTLLEAEFDVGMFLLVKKIPTVCPTV